jgi:hypothetical protein
MSDGPEKQRPLYVMIHREESASLVQMLLSQNRIQVAADNPSCPTKSSPRVKKRTYLLVNNSLAAVNGPRFKIRIVQQNAVRQPLEETQPMS